MKKVISTLLVLAIVVCLPLAATAAPSQYKITVSYTAKMLSNDHVGNSWATWGAIGDTALKKGKAVTVTVAADGTLTVICTAQEKDKTPDTGSCEFKLAVGDLKAGKNTIKQTATVTEDKGRYAGNKAQWEFTLTVTKKAA